MKKVIKYMLCFLGAAVMLSGCYRDELATLHNQIDNLDVRSMEDQISEIKQTLADLETIKAQIEPAVKTLQGAKAELEQKLTELEAQAATAEGAAGDAGKSVAELQQKISNVESAIDILKKADIDNRIKELEKYVKGLGEEFSTLQTAYEGFATIDQLTALEAAVKALPDSDFDVNFDAALEKSKSHIISWISDGETFKKLFLDYYTKAEIDAMLDILDDKDDLQDDDIDEFRNALKSLDTEIKKALETAVADAKKTSEEAFNKSVLAIGERLDGIDKVITKILEEYIGDMTTLKIETDLVKAINALYDKYGTFDGTVEAIITALKADIAILNAADSAIRGDAADSVTLNSLNSKIGNLASISSVNDLKDSVKVIQTAFAGMIRKEAFDEAIAAYLTKEDAEKTYATASALNDFIATYNEVVGDKTSPAAGSILARIAILGNGSFTDNWVTDLTTAVNTLHGLVGTSSVSDQAETIAEGIVNDFVKQILADGEATADSLKNLLSGFNSSIQKLGTDIGDMSKLGSDPDIATAIYNIKTTLSTLDATYAAKTHTHTCSEITDFTTELTTAITSIAGVLTELRTTAKETLVAAINELVDTLAKYETEASARLLLSELQKVLYIAVRDGGEGFNAYFRDLNLHVLDSTLNVVKNNIGDIVKATDGTIDSRVSAAIDALNISSYLTIAGLNEYGFLTGETLDTAALSALAALKVTIGKETFNYKELDKAVETVFDSLEKYVGPKYSEAAADFESLDTRFKAIEDMIGEGFDEKSIAATLGELKALFGVLGDDNTVKDLIDGLQTLNDRIIVALLGNLDVNGDGKVDKNDINDKNNLNAIKTALDTLGLENVSAGETTLAAEIAKINEGLEGLRETIGGSFSKDSTVADAILSLQNALGGVEGGAYKNTISNIQTGLTDLLNACSGKTSGGSIADVTALVSSLVQIDSTLKNLNINGNNLLEDVVEDIDYRLDSLGVKIVGDPKKYEVTNKDGEKVEIDTSLVVELLRIKERINGMNIGEIIENTPSISSFISNLWNTVEGIVYNIFVGNPKDLKTDVKTDIVSALNSLCDSLDKFNLYATKKQLDTLRNDILKGAETGEFTYKTIKALSEVFAGLETQLGTAPEDFAYESLYGAVEAFEEALSTTFGNAPSGSEFEGLTVWEAIEQLKLSLCGSLRSMLNSLVFIPEFDDGCATLPAKNGMFTDMELNYKVNATSKFVTAFGTDGGDSFSVSGLFKKAGRSGKGTTIGGQASLSDGILSVTFASDSLSEKITDPEGLMLSLVITDKRSGYVGQNYMTNYTQVVYSPEKITLSFSETTWEGVNAFGGTNEISVTSAPTQYDEWNVTSSADWLTVEKNASGDGVILTVQANLADQRDAIVSFSNLPWYVNGNTITVSQEAGFLCLAAGTKITMADGSCKKIEDIVEGDLVKTFDHESGHISSAKVCLTYKGENKATPLILSFESGKKLSIVGTHDLLLQNTRKYVRINSGNVASYIGKSFYNAESGEWDKLIGHELGTTPVDYYCIYSSYHLNCIAEGMLTVPDDEDYFLNIYELDSNLKADPVQLAADIKKYGLMDVAKDYPHYSQYKDLTDALLCQYLYIVLGKGLATQDDVNRMLNDFWDGLE